MSSCDMMHLKVKSLSLFYFGITSKELFASDMKR